SACATNNEPIPEGNSGSMEDKKDDSPTDHDMEGHIDHDEEVSLNNSAGENELKIPPVLDSISEDEVTYIVRAQKGETEIFDGTETKTYGYNGDFLGQIGRASCRERV